MKGAAIFSWSPTSNPLLILASILVSVLALASILAGPVYAAQDGDIKAGKPGTNVEMPFLVAPLSDGDGKLLGYAYISSRLTAMSNMFALAVRDKIAFIQDALVRDVNASSIALPDAPESVDIGHLEARMLADARKIMGAGKVKQVTVCTVQIAELHASRAAAPQPGSAAAPQNPGGSRCES